MYYHVQLMSKRKKAVTSIVYMYIPTHTPSNTSAIDWYSVKQQLVLHSPPPYNTSIDCLVVSAKIYFCQLVQVRRSS